MSPHAEAYHSSGEGSDNGDMRAESPPALTRGVSPAGSDEADGFANGRRRHGNRHSERSQYVLPSDLDSEFDLVCVGFGPASLAIAVALHDAVASGQKLNTSSAPKVLFLEKQPQFAWHAGMLLPGAKMQISFVKDLATLRDPRSEFTFVNYLHRQGRLVDFTNLGTFLPARVEYEDYLSWCASFFSGVVQYHQQVVSVSPEMASNAGKSGVQTFTVKSANVNTGREQTFRARNVLVATGGQPSLPRHFPLRHPRVIHSSQYAHAVPRILPKQSAPYRVAVVGAGQSAAEIFNNIQTLYPNSRTLLVMRPEFLRPSDDSPFVNSIFNPEYIDDLYPKPAQYRNNLLSEARATNYGVVRLELIEHLFERMYDQRREIGPDETAWPHRIMGGRQVASVQGKEDGPLEIKIRKAGHADVGSYVDGYSTGAGEHDDELTLEVDLIIAATGYKRAAHLDMLQDTWEMLPKTAPSADAAAMSGIKGGVAGWDVPAEDGERKMSVGRDYQVRYAPGAVAEKSGVWLQGCCEGTHGLSDTLLSVLATRSGEIVNSIFGA